MPPDCPAGECIASDLKAELAALRVRVDGLERRMEAIAADVRALLDIAATGRGSLRALLLIGAVLTSVASGIAWLYGTFVAGR